jgi:glycosyltransferase involved in cell wall biosynthesis
MINNKVIHLITTLERGGAENQLLILAREQVIQGLDVEVINLKGKPDLVSEFEILGVKVNRFVANKNFFNQIKILRRYFHAHSVLVHTHLPRAEVMAYLTVVKGGFLISRHNYEQFWPSAPKIVSAFLSRIISSRAIGGIAISRALKEYLIENREISNIFPMKVIYYGYGSKPDFDFNSNTHDSKISNLTNEAIKIGIISRLVPGKDYPTLFKAIQRVLDGSNNIVLLIVGDGYQKKDLLYLTKTLGIDNKVFWFGKISGITRFLSELDLFVFTSKGEGFGLVILEAMLASKPILASNNSAIPEVLGKNYPGLFETGNYQELASKITRVIENSDFSRNLIDSYQPQIELFNPKKMAKIVKHTYEMYGF